jgi:hypothetical protein
MTGDERVSPAGQKDFLFLFFSLSILNRKKKKKKKRRLCGVGSDVFLRSYLCIQAKLFFIFMIIFDLF